MDVGGEHGGCPVRILGVDPGLNITGYSVLEAAPGLSLIHI